MLQNEKRLKRQNVHRNTEQQFNVQSLKFKVEETRNSKLGT